MKNHSLISVIKYSFLVTYIQIITQAKWQKHANFPFLEVAYNALLFAKNVIA
jgi:hypothetical protein